MYGFANVGTCLAFFVKSKKESVRQTSIGAMLSQLFGISEPVLFGIQLRYNLRPPDHHAVHLRPGRSRPLAAARAVQLLRPGPSCPLT